MKTTKKSPVIGIIGGTGKMGQWLKAFFEHHDMEVLISGRKTKLSTTQLVKKSDIVIVSVPIHVTEEVLKKIIPLMNKNQLLSDITSMKVMPLSLMKDASSATLGMHLLFGPSITTALGLKVVFCRQQDNQYVKLLRDLFEKSGMEIIEMSAEEHDYHMAYIQALTHAVNLLYAKIMFDQKDAISNKLGTPISMLQTLLMGRVLQQDLEMLADIEIYNPYFMSLLEDLSRKAKELLEVVQDGERKKFVKMFEKEKSAGKYFSSFSVMQTDKIMRLVSDIPASYPVPQRSIKVPANATIAFLGPEGTYSHQIALTTFPKNTIKKIACDSIFEVFNKVLEGEVDFGIVPAENSIEGTVKTTIDYLIEFSLYTLGSIELPIHHQLLSIEKSLNTIKTIVSHPQALAQCKYWIAQHLPTAKLLSAQSTTSDIAQKLGFAYISSAIAAKKYHMPILAKNIEDNPSNATRFYVISRNQINLPGISNQKTLVFLTVYNRVGILRDILNIFAKHELNLTKLESRPSLEKMWDYYFFVEVEAKVSDNKLQKALTELETYCPVIKILGQT